MTWRVNTKISKLHTCCPQHLLGNKRVSSLPLTYSIISEFHLKFVTNFSIYYYICIACSWTGKVGYISAEAISESMPKPSDENLVLVNYFHPLNCCRLFVFKQVLYINCTNRVMVLIFEQPRG